MIIPCKLENLIKIFKVKTDVIEKDEFDIYLPQSDYQSPKRRRLDSSIPRVHQTQPVNTNVGTFRESAHMKTNVAPNHPSRRLKTNISTV